MNRYLVTGAAGFIGAHVSAALLDAGHEVVGLDSVNDYTTPPSKGTGCSRFLINHIFPLRKATCQTVRLLNSYFEAIVFIA